MRGLFFGVLAGLAGSANAQSYTSFLIGSALDVTVPHEYGLCLMGGATENDQAMRWFLQQANGGDVVVLRASGGNGYNAYFYSQLGVPIHSVETLVVPNIAAANDPYVAQQVRQAEAIWIAGGNQATYIQQWSGTALDSALQEVIHVKRVTVGGTSAGMAILGQGVNTAFTGSVSSSTALSNPFHPSISLQWNGFLGHPLLSQTITDTHFDNPDRRGRLTVFLARFQATHGNTVKGLACDEYTAVCIDSTGMARVFGEWPLEDDNAYFVQINCQPPYEPEVLSLGSPLTWNRNNQALKVYRIQGDTAGTGTFNVTNWTPVQGGNWLHWWVQSGSFFSSIGSPFMPCAVAGTSPANPQKALVHMWPNPFGSTLSITTSAIPYRIVHVSGKEVFRHGQGEETSTSIDTKDWPVGLYFLEYSGYREKLIKLP